MCTRTRYRRTSGLFFFQAEDGIRDGRVTGVQTCALPIFGARGSADVQRLARLVVQADVVGRLSVAVEGVDRSEERRGGEEGWFRGGSCPFKINDGRATEKWSERVGTSVRG